MRSYLNDCQKIEQVMGEFYRKLAGFPSYSRSLREIFEQMAEDEDDHARQLEIAKGVPEDLFFAGTSIEAERLDRLLQRAQQLLKLADDPPRSESLMLETARDMEQEFMEVHLKNSVRFHRPELAGLFEDLAREDEKHLETLDTYYQRQKPSPGHTLH